MPYKHLETFIFLNPFLFHHQLLSCQPISLPSPSPSILLLLLSTQEVLASLLVGESLFNYISSPRKTGPVPSSDPFPLHPSLPFHPGLALSLLLIFIFPFCFSHYLFICLFIDIPSRLLFLLMISSLWWFFSSSFVILRFLSVYLFVSHVSHLSFATSCS